MNTRSEPTPNHTRADRRTNRTRRLLRNALMAAILEKGYDAITIEDITERADLGRTTFYLHYKDKEDLLIESLEAITDELRAQVGLGIAGTSPDIATGNPSIPSPSGHLQPLQESPQPGAPSQVQLFTQVGREAIALVFCHAAENATFYRILLSGGGAPKAISRVRDILASSVQEFFAYRIARQQITISAKFPMEIIASYFASSMLGLLNWWLEKDMPYSPEAMTDIFISLFFRGASQVMGIQVRE